MPKFDKDVEIDLDIDEFLEHCSSHELKNIYESLREDYADDIEPDEKIRSESQRIFINHLNHLRDNWYSISKEDAEIISVIAKKYGAV